MPAPQCLASRAVGLMLLAAAVAGIAGCSRGPSLDPVEWWHHLEGGPIAEQRPPPPNVDAPYPSLATVPTKPVPTDPAIRTKIARALVADRANADYAASLAPIAPPAPARVPATPGPAPSPATSAAGDDSVSSASLQAASAPQPTAPANVKPPVAAAPSTVPPPVQSASSAPAGPAPAGGDAASAAPPPPVPDAPPAPPTLGGVPATVPKPPPPTPPAPPVPPAPFVAGPVVPVGFVAGSAEMPSTALASLKELARRRGAAVIDVTGFGEATSSSPAEQAAALPLAWARARTVAASLATAGVPLLYIRIDAQAIGQGAVASLAPKPAP